jgi:FGGY-family pentulose kinase
VPACYIGIDVGTGSARAGVFTAEGVMLGAASHAIEIWRPEPDFVEQSSDDIWSACGEAVRNAMAQAGVPQSDIRGIGFDATCSLVALDRDDRPVSLSPTADDRCNVIVWMDHRAIAQAKRINSKGHAVLRYVGGKISPEMQTPKLLWLKENLPKAWERTARFLDLPDFLTYLATGSDVRSLCSTVCKWTYLGHERKWDSSYFRDIGLGALVDEDFERIGRDIRPMGEPVGDGLVPDAAANLGLPEGIPVGVSMIDAHAGGIGVLGAKLEGTAAVSGDLQRRLALIGGTSSCHMAVSQKPCFVPGVWGPYYSAMVPGMWLSEGGQSATGSLVDHVIFSHARATELGEQACEQGTTVYDVLNRRLDAMSNGHGFPAALTRDLHVLPYFHGNRSPRADPTLAGAIAGFRLSDTLDDLARLYLATIQAIAYGTRHIISVMNEAGYTIDTVLACGGGTKNPVFLREHADITGCRVVLPAESEAVLLGAAILGAVAAGDYSSVVEAMAAMNRAERVIEPTADDVARYHAAKYAVFHHQYEDLMRYREIMSEFSPT